jgi:hypothetical protein
VKKEVDNQIKDHISPGTLQQQSKEAKTELENVKNAHDNSYVSRLCNSNACVSETSVMNIPRKARRKNAAMSSSNLHDLFAVVLNSQGKRSKVWPVDLMTLFTYDRKYFGLIL